MLKKKNLKTQVIYLVSFVLFMIGLSYASVPLYKLFCQVTGFAGTPMISSKNNLAVLDKVVHVRLDSSVEKPSPLIFEPVSRKIETKIGENKLVFYKAKNLSDKEVIGTATFNVSPLTVGQYFNKIECFCFEEQIFKPGQEVEMPVSFFIDPEIASDKNMKSIDELTLSYTMYIKNNKN